MAEFLFHRIRLWLCGAVVLVSLTPVARAQYDPEWGRNFRLGAVMGFNIKANFKISGSLSLGADKTGPLGTSGQSHVFDDGYVRPDNEGNDNPDPSVPGYTSFFGYQNSGQHVGQTLQFHHASSFDSGGGVSASKDAGVTPGVDLAYGGYLWRWDRVRLGWEIGVGWLPIRISEQSTIIGSISQDTFSFDIPDNVLLPPPPYNGAANSSGTGASIFDIANPVSTDALAATNSGKRTLDVNLFTLRLGPSLFWDISPRFGLTAGAGPAIGIVSGDLSFKETITPAGGVGTVHKGKISSTEVLFGGYVNAVLTYHIEQNGDLFLGVQYMPLGTATIGGGGRSAKLDLSGAVYISAGINWPF